MKRKPLVTFFPFRFALIISPLLAAWPQKASAVDRVWDVNLGAGPWVWNTAANWTGAVAPVTNADRGDLRKDWTAAATINFNAATTINGILFDDTGATADVGVTLANGGTAANTLTLAGTTPVVQVDGSTLTISTIMGGSTAWSKTGAGVLILSAANTYNGSTTVADGTLQIRNAAALGVSTSTVVVTNGGTPAATDINVLTLTGGITVNRNLLLENTGNTFSRPALVSNNALNANGNTWSGSITVKGVSNQTIQADTAPLTLTGAILNDAVTPSTNVFFRGGNTGTLAASATVDLGSAVFFKTDGGTWNANNTASMTVGTTQISDGTVSVGANNALSTTAPLIIGQGSGTSGTLNIANGISQTISAITVAAGSTGTQRITGPGSLDTGAVNRTYLVNDSAGIPQDLIISAPVTGIGGFTKTGIGTLAVNSTVEGPVTASAGRVEGSGTFNGGLTITGATLSPGSDLTSGALTTSGLSFSGASNLNLNVGPGGEFITNTGILSATDTTTVTLSATGTLPSSGQINLVTHNGTLSGLGSFSLAALPGRVTGALQNSGTALVLNITGNDKVIWTGAAGAAPIGEAWDINTTANWKLLSNNTAVNFLQGDDVIFNDTGLNASNVTLNAAAVITGADFQNTTAVPYTIKGSGGMAGSGGVVKSGNGAVTLAPVNAALAANATAHTYVGTTTVSAGTLTLDYTGLTGTNAATNRVIGNGDISVAAGATLTVVRDNQQLNLPNSISGAGTVTADLTNGGTTGSRNFAFTGNNSGFSGTLNLMATGAGATGTYRTINAALNGAAPLSAFGTAMIDVDAGAQMWGAAGTYTNDIRITGAGYSEAGGGTTPDADLTALGFANYAGLGAIRMENGSVYNGNITLQGSAKVTVGTAAATATIGGNLSLTNAGDVFVFGGNNGNTVNQLNLTGDNSGLGRIWVNSGGSGGTTAEDRLRVGNNGTTGTIGSGNITLHADAARQASIHFARTDGYTLGAGNNIIADANATADFARTTLSVNGGGLTMAGQTIDLADATTGGSIRIGQTNAGAVFNIGAGSTVETGFFGLGEGANNSATVIQTGGNVTLIGVATNGANSLRVGHFTTNTSLYNLSGNGTINFTAAAPAATPSGTAELGGGIYVGVDGQGIFNQSGNSVVSTNFVVLDNRGETLAGANMATGIDEYNLSGGQLELKSIYGIIGRNASTELNLTGGTIRNTGADATDVAINVVTNAISGTTTLDTVNATRKFTLMNDVLGSGTLAVTGGGVIELEPDSKAVRNGASDGLGTQMISAAITGTSALTKLGTGTTTLSGTSTYNGATTLSAGRLNITGSIANSALTAATGTTLAGEGTVGALTLAGGGTLLIDGSTAAALTSTGNLTASGVTNVNFSMPPTTASVTVLNHAATTALPANFALVDAGNYRSSTFAVNAGNVTLAFGRKDLVWGGTTANWEIGGADNDWNAGVDNYFNADGVTFNDSNVLNNSIALVGTLSNSAIVVNSNTNQFSFNGSAGNVIGGASSLLKDGTSTLTINAPNTYTGGTVISEGEIMARNNAALGAGTVTLGDAASATAIDTPTLLLDVAGAAASLTITNNIIVAAQAGPVVVIGSTATGPVVDTLQANFNGTLTLNDNLQVRTGAGDFTRINGAISGNGNLELVNGSLTGDTRGNAGNRLLLAGNANAWTGGLTIKAGTATNFTVLQTNTANSLNDNIAVTVEDNAVFRLNASEGIDVLTGSSAARVRGAVAVRVLTVGLNNGSSVFAGIMENDPFDAGTLALTKTGNGTLSLTGTNTYTGATSVTGGSLLIGDGGGTGSLGTTAVTLSAGTTLTYNRTGAVTQAGALNSAAAGAGILNVNGDASTALTLGAGGNFSGVINVNNGTLIYGATNPTAIAANAPNINLAAGTTLTNSTTSTHGHVGNLTLNAATWTTSATGGSYNTENYQLNGNVTVNGTAASIITRDPTRTNADSGIALNGARIFTVNNVAAGTDLTISTELENTDTATPPGGLIKEGAGTLSLTADNSYTGVTTVNAGTLLINGNHSAATGAITVGAGATLGGSGTLGGAITFDGGVFAPGNSPGTMTTSGPVTFGATSVLNYEFTGTNTAVGGGINDLLTGVTNLTLGGTLNVAEIGAGSFLAAVDGNMWRVMDYSGTLTGSLALGTTPALAPGLNFQLNTGAGQVNLVVVPEASAVSLLGLATLFTLRRRRGRHAA